MEKKTKSIFLNNFAICIYLLIYITLFIVLDFRLLQQYPFLFLFKILVGTYVFLYKGLIALKSRRILIWRGDLKEGEAITFAIIAIFISIIILFSSIIISFVNN